MIPVAGDLRTPVMDIYSSQDEGVTWQRKRTLLRLKSGWPDQTAEDIDAAHPGGAVIDEALGVQHVFIYCGTFGTPAGIYRITRTLDTKKLGNP